MHNLKGTILRNVLRNVMKPNDAFANSENFALYIFPFHVLVVCSNYY